MRFSCWVWSVVLALTFSAPAAVYEVAQRHAQASDDGPGTPERPWKTVAKAAQTARAGDLVLIRDGVYRERVVAAQSGTEEAPIRFQAAPGARVVLTGAERLSDWQKAEGQRPIYHVPWAYRFNTWSKTMAHPDDEYHRLVGRCEQVMLEGYFLRQVLEAGQLAPGTFFVDLTNRLLQALDFAGRDLNHVLVEASVRQEIFRVEGAHVQLRGLRFCYAANPAQHGAVVLAGSHDRMEDCTLERMNASGASFVGESAVVRGCVFRDNGQLGFGAARAHRLLFTECLVENNNTKGFDRGWEAGGNKLVLCRDVMLQECRFVRNRGHGIWFDIGNEHCTVHHCLIADNEDSGIFDEISFGFQAHDNVIVGNGFASTRGAWGAQAGISLSSSPDCVLERNLIVENREGLDFREQMRTTSRIDGEKEVAIWNHDELIRSNIIANNRDAQVWGWFDVDDNRHWPARGRSVTGVSAASGTGGDRQSQGLSLEKLQLKFEGNIYYAAPEQGAFEWGVSWRRHKSYRNLADFQTDLQIDSGSRMLNADFVNARALDFRLKPEVMLQVKPNYPRGSVPGVVLGSDR